MWSFCWASLHFEICFFNSSLNYFGTLACLLNLLKHFLFVPVPLKCEGGVVVLGVGEEKKE